MSQMKFDLSELEFKVRVLKFKNSEHGKKFIAELETEFKKILYSGGASGTSHLKSTMLIGNQ